MLNNFLKSPKFFLILILILHISVRFYKLDSPIADWHSWRQADTAAVARNFFKEGYNPLIPKYDDMSGVAQYPIPNPNRYRFVEFPIYGSLVYFGYLLNNGVDERIARIINIVFSAGSLIFIYALTKKYFSTFSALLASLIFAALPFNIYFSRVILPEPSLVFFSLGMFYLGNEWIFKGGKKLFLLGMFFTTCAFLTKPTAIFYALPLLFSIYKKEKKLFPLPKRYFFFFIPALLPLLFWRVWINQHPEGIPASKWLLNGNGIRFKPIFWQWILGDRFGREILGVTGTILFFFGILKKPSTKEGSLLHVLASCVLLFLIVFATGNVQHDYYQTLIIPVLVIFIARGIEGLLKGSSELVPRIITIPLSILLLVMMFYTTWDQIKGLYQVNNYPIVAAGREADRMLPKNAVVIAPYSGDTSFLYQTNRAGWPVVAFPVKDLKDMFGARYFVSVAKDAKTKWVMRKYTILKEEDIYVIVDLTRENPNFDAANDPEPM